MSTQKNATPQSEEEALLAEIEAEEAKLRAELLEQQQAEEAKLTDVERGFRDRRKKESKRLVDATDSEYWFCVSFQTREQCEAFLKTMRWEHLGNKYLNGYDVAAQEGFDLPPADVRFVESKPDKKLNEISLPLP